MDHHYIEEQGIVTRYLLDKLSVEERIRFEEHYVDCNACLDQLDLGDDCIQVIQNAAGNVQPMGLRFPAELFLRLTRLNPRWQATLFYAALLLLILIPLLSFEFGRLHWNLNQLKAVAVEQPSPLSSSISQETSQAGDGERKLPVTSTGSVGPAPQPSSQPAPPVRN